MSVFREDNKEIDVERIMDKIKEKIRERSERCRGDSNKERYYIDTHPELQSLHDTIMKLAMDHDPRIGNHPVTHRENWLGRVIVLSKRVFLKIFKLYGNALLNKQSLINEETVRILQRLAAFTSTTLHRVDTLRQENIVLRAKVESLLEYLDTRYLSDNSKKEGIIPRKDK